MRILKLIIGTFCLSWGISSCQKQDMEEQHEHTPNVIHLHFSGRANQTNQEVDDLTAEEGKVNNLLYALFHKEGTSYIYKQGGFIESVNKHTGDSYPIKVDNQEWLKDAKIFIVANPTQAIRDSIKLKGEKDISVWEDYEFTYDLNEEAGKNDSRLIENPVMAGYLATNSIIEGKVNISVEHIYCRIWCSFIWRNQPEAEQVTIDEIKMEGLHKTSKLFNCSSDPQKNNSQKDTTTASLTIQNKQENQKPFLGCLIDPTHHIGENPEMIFDFSEHEDHHVLCRYHWKNGSMDTKGQPVRYYTYSYQYGSMKQEDDVKITVKYHFKKTKDHNGNPITNGEIVHKTAWAYLYDESYTPGKRHHGLLRNYTYKLKGMINTTTEELNLQITAQEWYKININDIPTFE